MQYRMSEESVRRVTEPEPGLSGGGSRPVFFPQDAEVSLFEVKDILLRERGLIMVVTLLFTLGAALYAFSTKPLSRSSTLVRIQKDRGNQAQALLRSTFFFEDFVRSENLLPLIFSDRWDPVAGVWQSGKGGEPSLREGARLLKGRVTVARQKIGGGLVKVVLEDSDPALANDMLDRLMRRVNEAIRLDEVDKAKRKIAYLRQQLRVHDSLQVARFTPGSAGLTGSLPMKALSGERPGVFGFLHAQMQLSASSIERQRLVDAIYYHEGIVMQASIAPGEFALKVYDPAESSLESVHPERASVVVLGFAGGLFSSVFLAFTRGFFRQRRGVDSSML